MLRPDRTSGALHRTTIPPCRSCCSRYLRDGIDQQRHGDDEHTHLPAFHAAIRTDCAFHKSERCAVCPSETGAFWTTSSALFELQTSEPACTAGLSQHTGCTLCQCQETGRILGASTSDVRSGGTSESESLETCPRKIDAPPLACCWSVISRLRPTAAACWRAAKKTERSRTAKLVSPHDPHGLSALPMRTVCLLTHVVCLRCCIRRFRFPTERLPCLMADTWCPAARPFGAPRARNSSR